MAGSAPGYQNSKRGGRRRRRRRRGKRTNRHNVRLLFSPYLFLLLYFVLSLSVSRPI